MSQSVGGGSVIDTAKAANLFVSVHFQVSWPDLWQVYRLQGQRPHGLCQCSRRKGASNLSDPTTFNCRHVPARAVLRYDPTHLFSVPTTAGTGSETTGAAIFDVTSRAFKTGIANRALKPVLGIVDTANTESCPTEVHISAGLDVLFHSMESYTAIP